MYLNFDHPFSESCVVKLKDFIGKIIRSIWISRYIKLDSLKNARKELHISTLFPEGTLSYSGSNALLNYLY